MDTIQISIKLSKEKMKGITYDDLSDVAAFINDIKSPNGYRYCKCLEISRAQNIVVKLSFPKFYKGINAFLITSSIQCIQVQHEFCLEINSHSLLNDAHIYLNRVDIPFTFYMDKNYNFNSYRKVYQIFDYVYTQKNIKASPNAITDVKNFKAETVVYSDTANISAYNSKIMIYDQYKNIRSKTSDEKDLYEIDAKYDDLSRRMRIEVSKRIRRKAFTIEEFVQFNIYSEYSLKYKEYILENILDLSEVKNFYDEKSQELAERLLEYRESLNYFNYENFIYREIQYIHDYEIIRRALKICIEKKKTREKAVTTIKRVLFNYQLNENIIVMETFNTILSIRNVIENYFIG